MLNHIEIKSRNLIKDYNLNNFQNAAYDVQVDKLITTEGDVVTDFEIKPNCMVVAISKEVVKLPSNILGNAYVRTTLSQKGILAINIGLIDAQYEGPLSSVLVNFGKKPFRITRGEKFLRLTFAKFKRLNSEDNIELGYKFTNPTDYENARAKDAMKYLGNSFIDLENVVKDITTEINDKRDLKISNRRKVTAQWATAITLGLTFGGLIVNIVVNSHSNNESMKSVAQLEEKVLFYKSQQELMLEQQENVMHNLLLLTSGRDSTGTFSKESIKIAPEYNMVIKP